MVFDLVRFVVATSDSLHVEESILVVYTLIISGVVVKPLFLQTNPDLHVRHP